MSYAKRRSTRSAASLVAIALALGAVGCAQREAPRSTLNVIAAKPSGAQEGECSWYGREQHGHLTASGQRFDMYALTAAHRTLPMGTRVKVTNLRNGRSVVVRINDRGPYSRRRIIDVSFAAARALGMLDAGVVPARVEVVSLP
jgi:rare lipoprotein A